MNMWKKLHFRKNPDCKTYDKQRGLNRGYNNHFQDSAGKYHNVSAARAPYECDYKIPKKYGCGHQKANKKKDLQDAADKYAYLMDAVAGNNEYINQLLKDVEQAEAAGLGFAVGEEKVAKSSKKKK